MAVVYIARVANYTSFVEGVGPDAREVGCVEPISAEAGKWRAAFRHITRGLYSADVTGRSLAEGHVTRLFVDAGYDVQLYPAG